MEGSITPEKPPKIIAKSSAGHVQGVLKYAIVQWNRFLVVTNDEAQQEQDYFGSSFWRDVPAEPQQKLIDRVKERLQKEGIPCPDDDLEKAIIWRMSQVFKGKKSKGANLQSPDENINTPQQKQASPTSKQDPSYSSSNKPRSLPFDPIRPSGE